MGLLHRNMFDIENIVSLFTGTLTTRGIGFVVVLVRLLVDTTFMIYFLTIKLEVDTTDSRYELW